MRHVKLSSNLKLPYLQQPDAAVQMRAALDLGARGQFPQSLSYPVCGQEEYWSFHDWRSWDVEGCVSRQKLHDVDGLMEHVYTQIPHALIAVIPKRCLGPQGL